MSHRSRLTFTALTLVAAAALAPQAQAAGFQLREQSASSLGNAFAGVSAGGSDISALFFNPAVLTQYEGTTFSFGATYVGISAKFSGASANRTPVLQGLGFFSAPVTGASLSPISGASSTNNAAVPAALPEFNIAYSLSKDVKVGLSVNVPFGLTTEYDANWIGRYHGLKSDLKTIDVAPSIAFRMEDGWTVGAAFVLRKADAELSNGVDFGTALALKVGGALAAAGLSTVSPSPSTLQNSPVATIAMGAPSAVLGTPGYATPGAWDGTAGLKGSGWGYGWKAGATYQIPDLRIGLAYAAAMHMNLKGDATFVYPTTIPSTDLAALNAAGLKNGGGSADLNLPATASIGIDWQVAPDVSVQAEVARTTWSRFRELRVKFDSGAPDSITDESWQDSTFLSVGTTWKASSQWSLRCGMALDKSAVDDAHRTPRIPDNDRQWASVGASYTASKKVTVDFGYTYLRVGAGKVMLSPGTSPFDISATRGSLNGSIAAKISLLGASVRYNF